MDASPLTCPSLTHPLRHRHPHGMACSLQAASEHARLQQQLETATATAAEVQQQLAREAGQAAQQLQVGLGGWVEDGGVRTHKGWRSYLRTSTSIGPQCPHRSAAMHTCGAGAAAGADYLLTYHLVPLRAFLSGCGCRRCSSSWRRCRWPQRPGPPTWRGWRRAWRRQRRHARLCRCAEVPACPLLSACRSTDQPRTTHPCPPHPRVLVRPHCIVLHVACFPSRETRRCGLAYRVRCPNAAS